ncbi:MAG: cytochrome c [Dongiaceae bacterium]
MKSSRKIALVAGGALVATVVAMTGYAVVAAHAAATVQVAATPAEAIKERQALMKDQGKHAKAINEFVESGMGTAADVATHAAALKEDAGKIPALFPAGTGADDGVAETAAKKEIWDDFAAFEAAASKLGDLAGAVEAAAAAGDKQQIADAFETMGKEGCGGCHSTFRLKKN